MYKCKGFKSQSAFWRLSLLLTESINLNLILIHCSCVCVLWRVLFFFCFFSQRRCAYPMSRGNGIISTITGRSQPAVTTTAWYPLGNCLAPATCRFHKPAIRHWACISQHTLWNICLSVCVHERDYRGDRQMWKQKSNWLMRDRESFLLCSDKKEIISCVQFDYN